MSRYDTLDWTIEMLIRNIDKGQLAVCDSCVHHWMSDQESRFVESFLCGLPVPQITVRELDDGRCFVVDGNRRCMALYRYVCGGSSLRELELRPDLEGTTFSGLGKAEMRKFLNRTLRVFLITKILDGWLDVVAARLNSGKCRQEKL